ncbi:MAG: hypothetical protein AB8D52_10405 [Gammaproteobacteria bacterium]
MDKPADKLKVGLILDNSSKKSVWVSRLIKDIDESSFAAVEITLISDAPERADTWKHKLYTAFCEMERYRWSCTEQDRLWLDKNDLLEEKIEGYTLNLSNPSQECISAINNANLDVLLNLTQVNISDQIFSDIKANIWSLHFKNGKVNKKTSPVGFWEIYDNSPTMKCLLTESTGKLLYQSVHPLDENFSARLTQKTSYRVGYTTILRKLEQLYNSDVDHFLSKHIEFTEKHLQESNDFRSGKPGNLRMIIFFAKKIFNSLKMRVINALYVQEWSLRYELAEGLSMEFDQFEKLEPTLGGLWADPFIIHRDNSYFLFFEDAITDQENADISVVRIEENGSMGEIKPCLIKPYHLSYPYVFFWEGEYYMVPETGGNRTIEIYKASHFPDQWEFHSNLMEDIRAADTTLLFHKEKWWMFTNCSHFRGVNVDSELSIYYADSPLSQDWTLHPQSPVVSDVRRARSAGRIYEHDGKLIRPAQDSSVRYGYGFRLNEIITLTETEYEEREIDFIEPDWDSSLLGTHTIAHEKNLTVIDVLSRRSKYF